LLPPLPALPPLLEAPPSPEVPPDKFPPTPIVEPPEFPLVVVDPEHPRKPATTGMAKNVTKRERVGLSINVSVRIVVLVISISNYSEVSQ
jgi:hypothetical protein